MDAFAVQTYNPLPFAARLGRTKVKLLDVLFRRALWSLLQVNTVAEDKFLFPQVRLTVLPSSNVCISVTEWHGIKVLIC